MSKRSGRKSQAANDFLEPKPVESLTATDVGTSRTFNNGAANLSWSLPAGSPEATSYTITTTPSSTTETTSNTSFQFTGLSSNTSYTFSVVGSNAAGSSAATESSSVLITTVPAKPVSVSAASPSADQDVVSWSAGATGGKAITSFTVVSSDGPSYTNSTSPKTISETANTSQTYTIYAINDNGTSEGETTNSVTTTAPFFPPFFPYFPPFFPFFPFFPPYFPPFFPFFPFFPPYFPPFFPFFPFFPPFFPPRFGPFFPPAFGPYFVRCVDGDTLILTSEGLKPARDIKIGEKLLTVDAKAISGESNFAPLQINVQDLEISNLVQTEVTNVIASDKVDRVYFNNDKTAQFTETHPIFVKRNNEYRVVEAGTVQAGDALIQINIGALGETVLMSEVISEIEVTEVNKVTLDVAKDVYTFSCDSYNWYFAGNILTHNK
jgi:hypothetical protein